MHGETSRGSGGQKYFQKTEGEGPGFLCGASYIVRGLETLALSELHQHLYKLQVCENNWIRKIAGVRRVERRRMKDLLLILLNIVQGGV